MAMKKKKILSIILATVLVVGVSTLLAYTAVKHFVQQKNVEETGNVLGVSWYDETKTDFVISTPEELKEFARLSEYYTFEGQTVKLDADIVLNEGNAKDFKEQKPAYNWKPIMNFAGTFDGQGHTISGLYAKRTGGAIAMFLRPDAHCVVKDFSLKNCYFDTYGYSGVATIMARGGGEFSGIYTDAIINHRGQNVGGIASQVKKTATFEECWFDGSITITHRGVGGIVDVVDAPRVTLLHCLVTGSIDSSFDGTGTITTGTKTGGVVGHVNVGCALRAEDCFSNGSIKIKGTYYTGGMVGVGSARSSISIRNSYVSDTTYNVATGIVAGSIDGDALVIRAERLVGTKAYEWTDLDFDNYWAAIDKSTPVLKRFAESSLDLTGVKKRFDTSWYTSNEYTFTINTPEQLYGLVYVAVLDDMENKVVKLGTDIVLNEGNAEDWEKKAPANTWDSVENFSGTFDGQGHTISGIYCVSDTLYHGFINYATQTSTIKNVSIKNSFFYNSLSGDVASTGSLVGETWGKVENVYSNAIVISNGTQVGGIIGRTNDNDNDGKEDTVEVRGCWFDGSVALRGEDTMEAGGIIGRAVQGDLIFEDCLNTGTLSAEIKNNVPGLGGLIGVSWARGLQMSNCFSDGKLTYVYTGGVGGAVGRMPSKYTVANINGVYTTQEACNEGGMGGGIQGVVNGGVVQLPEEWYIGQNAARYTDLDFDKTWVLQKDGTPRLAHFTKATLSAKGVKKAYDTSWYKKDAKEVVIKTPEQFLGFTIVAMSDDFAGRTVKLGADIPMNLDKDWLSIGSTAKRFAGTFDGQGYTISGLKQKSSSSQMGLFGYVSITGKLKNFSLKDSTFEYYNEAANEQETIAQVGTVSSSFCGDMEKVYSNATITSNGGYVGGLVGSANAMKDDKGEYTTVTFKDCWFGGEVKMTGRWARFGGGIAGVMIQGNFEFINCLNSGTISNERPDGAEFLGGIIGTDGNNYIKCLIKDCLNTGTVTGANWNNIGAILGSAWKKTGVFTIENTYALDTSCVSPKGVISLTNSLGGTVNGGVTALREKELEGAGAYVWTTLDFKNHWAAIQDDYPVLLAFQKGVPLDGYKQMVDTSWYDEKKDSFTLKDEADLYGLARLVNAGNSFKGKTVKLGANIKVNTGKAENYKAQAPAYEWTPIGNEANRFKGTFDGDMHTISGLYMNRTERYSGLFGATDGATIKNLKVKNSYMASSDQWLGTLVGRGNAKFKNIYVDTIVEGGEAFTGGLVGQTDYGTSKFDTCWFDGTVINTYDKEVNSRGFVGGFIGYATKSTELVNCLYTGHIDISALKVKQSSGAGGFIGVAVEELKLNDSAMLGSIKRGVMEGYYAYLGANETTSFEGENVYSVHQAPNSDCTAWAGNYGGHGVPTFKHTPLSNRAKALGSNAKDNMSALDWENTWKVRGVGLPILKVFEDEKASYTITDSQDLYDFAKLVNTGTNFKGKTIKLGADIVLNTGSAADYATTAPKYTWTPIGYDYGVAPFKGTFDGQGHTISGLYVNSASHYSGLFGAVAEATIKDFKITNSYISSTGQWVGSVVGRGYGTFENIYSNAIVKSSKAFIGGLFGQLENVAKSQLKECWFDGTVISTSSGNSAGFIGGLVGYATTTMEMTNCLNTGHIDITATNNGTAGAGGFIGVLDAINKVATINNSAMLGTITANGQNGFYAIVGQIRNGTLAGSNIYIKVDRHSTAHTHFQGAYPGAAIAGFAPTRVTYGNVLGDAAKTTMPNLNWTDTWQTVKDKTPILKWTAGK